MLLLPPLLRCMEAAGDVRFVAAIGSTGGLVMLSADRCAPLVIIQLVAIKSGPDFAASVTVLVAIL